MNVNILFGIMSMNTLSSMMNADILFNTILIDGFVPLTLNLDKEPSSMKTNTSKIVTVMLAGGLLFGLFLAPSLNAQRKKSTTRKTATKKAKHSHRLPRYFGKIGISTEQKGNIYKIQEKYHSKIDDLKKQLAALKKKEMSEIETTLSASQKSALKKLRSKKRISKRKTTVKEVRTKKKK